MAAKQSWLARLFSSGKGQREGLTTATWTKGQVLLDDFEVERPLGQGGMGAVYLVRSRSGGEFFAVKTILASQFGDPASQRLFLDELQTWIDLPEHPHLTACRFFRTVGEQVAIFAEFVEGGTLEAWIQERKLTRLEQILDVAIQFAWGLHAAHELGVIHQDVKPGNVLMTAQGVVKITDFGLARARAMGGQRIGGGTGQSLLVSRGGMTPAYCSPEQAEGRPLSRRTDIWSWGLSVLEMFTGEVTWVHGTAATEVLESYLETGSADPLLQRMPAGVAEVLRKCLRLDPAERWADLAEAAEALKRVYGQTVGQDYPRSAPAAALREDRTPVTHDRRTTSGGKWTDPREWLLKAFQAEGRDAAEAEALLPARMGSRKAQAIADLAPYEEARRIFKRLVGSGRKDLETKLADLCAEKARIHASVDDIPGSIALHDQVIAICERLVQQEGRRELEDGLAKTYHNKALEVSALGDNRAAVALYDKAIAILERLVQQE